MNNRNSDIPPYTLIETKAALIEFYEQNKDVEWFCFDTEFIGEKRYTTLLCLIQVATEHGLYLIDSIKIQDLSLFLKIIEDGRVMKITHAGENDYRLLNSLYGTVPNNTWDAQIAAGFVGYRYPSAFRKLVEGEINVRLAKGFAVTDWEARPFSNKQIKYALNDVIYLKELYEKLTAKAIERDRDSWVRDECKLMTNADYYRQDPHREVLASNLIRNLRIKEQAFLIRLFAWRNSEAKRKDYSKEMVLQKKLIGSITKAIGAGKSALIDNRRIPDHIGRRYADTFERLYNAPMTEEEENVLSRIPKESQEDEEQNIMTEMLHLIIKNMCLQEEMAISLVMPRAIIRDMKGDPDYFEPILENTWRAEFFGKTMLDWLKNRSKLAMTFEDGNFRIEPEE